MPAEASLGLPSFHVFRFCHGCVLREQQRVAEDRNGRVPRWLKCMACREKTSFRPDEPKYHRLLIDLLGRTRQHTAVKIKREGHGDATTHASAETDADERISPKTSKVDEQSSLTLEGDSPAYGTRPSNKVMPTSLEDGEMSAFQRKWLSNLNKLKTIIRPDGSLDYSALDDESQMSMRNFVKVQRKHFRKREADEPSPMTDERHKLLVDANFNFKPLSVCSNCESSKVIPIPFQVTLISTLHSKMRHQTQYKESESRNKSHTTSSTSVEHVGQADVCRNGSRGGSVSEGPQGYQVLPDPPLL